MPVPAVVRPASPVKAKDPYERSNVKKEMRWAIPLEVTAGVVGISLWIGTRFSA